MDNIVLIENPKVVLNKFIKGLVYTVIITLLTAIIDAIAGGGLPTWEVFLTTVGYNVIVSLKKGLEEYKPAYALEFQWCWEPLLKKIRAWKC